MFILRKFRLRNKILLGFGAVIVLMMLSLAFGYLGIHKTGEDFSHYRTIARSNISASEVQEHLLASRLAFKKYTSSGGEEAKTEFEANFTMMEEDVNDARVNMTDPERIKKANVIADHVAEYRNGFNKVVEYQENSNALIYGPLTTTGVALESKLANLMTSMTAGNEAAAVYELSEIQRHFLLARLNVGKFLLGNNDEKFSEVVFEELDEVGACLDRLQDIMPEDDDSIEGLQKRREDYIKYFNEVVGLIKNKNKEIMNMDRIGPQITLAAEDIKASITDEQNTVGPKVDSTRESALSVMIVMSVIAIGFSMLVSIGLVRAVAVPVKLVTDTFKAIAEGETDLDMRMEVKSKDELGEMAENFNEFMDKLQVMIQSSVDENWLKTGQSELNATVRGEQDSVTLANNIIAYTAKYMDAQVGAIYLKKDEETFKMVGSYAYKKRKNLSNEYKAGEGLVGQAVLEKKTISITNVPDDYIVINSGLGESVPDNIIVTPCVYHGDVKCVIELGSFGALTEIQMQFLEQISEIIAISINSNEARAKMSEMLEVQIKQTEELQLQQEEMRAINEELEEQTRALQESEKHLQQQQEELRSSNVELEEQTNALKASEFQLQEQQEKLRVINEELEERSDSLERQRDEINKKNEILRSTQGELEKKAEDLQSANKYKTEFLANMSHELRTPLNSILILSKLLSQREGTDPFTEKELEFAKVINSSGTDLLNLINDILDLSKVEVGQMELNLEDVNLEEILFDVEQSFRQISEEKGLDFDVRIGEGVPEDVYTDYQRLKQVINNLLSNAFKFTEVGSISVEVTCPTKEEIEDADMDCDSAVKFSVYDTGIGISDDKQGMIFEAFKQSDGTISRKFGGTGLGLSISREFAMLLGGGIRVTSEEGKGSCFSIIIPGSEHGKVIELKRPEAEVTEAQAVQEPKQVEYNVGGISEKSLLIIERDQALAEALSSLADEKGFEGHIAADVEEGIQFAEKYNPSAIMLGFGVTVDGNQDIVEKIKSNEATKDIALHLISDTNDKMLEELRKDIIGKPLRIAALNELFEKIEDVKGLDMKKVLIVEDNDDQRFIIKELMDAKDVSATDVATGGEAYETIKNERFDCMILDLGLGDTTGFELLKKLKAEDLLKMPVVVYTAKELTQDEEMELYKYSNSIILKGPQSVDRLMAETSLFLHSVNSNIDRQAYKKVEMANKAPGTLVGKKILIIDDDMRNVFALTNALEENGMSVVIGKNGKEGIAKLNEHSDVDLSLVDIMMPEMDGYETMSEVRRIAGYEGLPIIALTAKAMKEDRNKCIMAGANDYMAKPVDIEKLVALLKVWLY